MNKKLLIVFAYPSSKEVDCNSIDFFMLEILVSMEWLVDSMQTYFIPSFGMYYDDPLLINHILSNRSNSATWVNSS